MRKNLSTTKDNPSKHFRSCGDYYGFGLVGKYNMKKHMSVFQFAGNDTENSKLQSLLKVFADDIDYGINRIHDVLPNSVYCGFSIMSSIAKIIIDNQAQCPHIYEELPLTIVLTLTLIPVPHTFE